MSVCLNKTKMYSHSVSCKSFRKGLTAYYIGYQNTSEPHRHMWKSFEPRSEKTGLRGFRPGPTQTRLYNYRRLLEIWNFGFRK